MSTRETYDAVREHWRYLRDAYMGGRYWANPSATTLGTASLRWQTGAIDESGLPIWRTGARTSYLVAHEGESDQRFDARRALAQYVNIVSPVVKAYAEGVTSRVTRAVEPLAAYLDDADRRGSAWGEVAEGAATWACVYGMVATVVDTPNVDTSALTEAQRIEAGIAPYVVTVHPPAWAWVECEDGRVVEFAYVSTPYRSELSSDGTADVELRVWRADRVIDGVPVAGGWEVRQGAVRLAAGQALGDTVAGLRVTASGPLPAALRGEIPVTFAFYERDASSDCPSGVPLIADTADASRVIYNALSWAMEVNRLAAFPFLAIPLASTGGQLDQATAVKVGPGQGLGFNSGAGAPQWVEPSGTSQRELREHCVFTFQWAMRTAGLELAADSSAQVQSGEALRIRSRDFESRALRFARNMQRWEIATLRLFARMAGADETALSVSYPKRITMSDPAEDLARALTVLAAPVEVGPKARAMLVRQVLDSSLSLSDEELSERYEEIEAIYMGDLATADAEQAVKRLRAQNEARGLEQVAATPEMNAAVTDG